ncbi:MAG TPA: hypothetical protein VLE97_03520 [Gaiellaceae bacterium]|nr:hypothetical protein [Gaiellaceae bacterium]
MPKKESVIPSVYPCMMQKDDLHRVSHPHDEMPRPPSAFRRLVTKLAAR